MTLNAKKRDDIALAALDWFVGKIENRDLEAQIRASLGGVNPHTARLELVTDDLERSAREGRP